jgi:ATP adenylyltransferase
MDGNPWEGERGSLAAMKVLWAPWRMDYILGQDRPKSCIFCPEPGEDFRDKLVLFSGSLTRVMMNKYPYINGHLLVSPIRHTPGLDELTPAEMLDLLIKLRESMAILTRVMRPDGFNVGLNLGEVAGAGMESHLHFHVVPRWNGDTNFIPVFAEVRVIPEHFRQTYERLAPHFQALSDEDQTCVSLK